MSDFNFSDRANNNNNNKNNKLYKNNKNLNSRGLNTTGNKYKKHAKFFEIKKILNLQIKFALTESPKYVFFLFVNSFTKRVKEVYFFFEKLLFYFFCVHA